MNITLQQALEFAEKTKVLGCCSLSGQSLVLMFDEIQRLNNLVKIESIPRIFQNCKTIP